MGKKEKSPKKAPKKEEEEENQEIFERMKEGKNTPPKGEEGKNE